MYSYHGGGWVSSELKVLKAETPDFLLAALPVVSEFISRHVMVLTAIANVCFIPIAGVSKFFFFSCKGPKSDCLGTYGSERTLGAFLSQP